MKEVAEMDPEELIAEALYLLQLCQMDINFGRPQTVWARAHRAGICCEALAESMFLTKREKRRVDPQKAAELEVGFLKGETE